MEWGTVTGFRGISYHLKTGDCPHYCPVVLIPGSADSGDTY